ncbi:MAG: hypothetical protein H6737_06805 [Alphaproteobacteria bacterium]|nr:hypothetical protein [Alphaproteobacteria bacterium]
MFIWIAAALADTVCVPQSYNAIGPDCDAAPGTGRFADLAAAVAYLNPRSGTHTIRVLQGHEDTSLVQLDGTQAWSSMSIQGDGTGASWRRDNGATGMLHVVQGANVTVSNLDFVAPNNSAAAYIVSGAVRFDQVTVRRESLIGSTSETAVAIDNGTLDLVQCDFQPWLSTASMGHLSIGANASVVIDGGAYASGQGTNAGSIHLTGALEVVNGALFENNVATGNMGGGAIRLAAAGSTLVVDNATFTANTHGGNRGGGAIYVQNGSVDITNADFEYNNAPAGTRGGGAIYVEDHVSFVVDASSFVGNTAVNPGGDGGAIQIFKGGAAGLTISRSSFVSNSAGGDGGAFAISTDGSNTYTALVEGCTFTTNTATNGGAVALLNQTLVSVDNVFQSNASVLGGAIYVASGSDAATSTNDTFCGQATASDGGAVWVSNGRSFDVTGGLFLRNTSSVEGGAMYYQGAADIEHSTFFDNTAVTGGGAVRTGANTTFRNNFVAYHDVLAVSQSGSDFDYNAWWSNLPAPGITGGARPNDQLGDPLIANLAQACDRTLFTPPAGSSLVTNADDGTDIGAIQSGLVPDSDGDGYTSDVDCDDDNPLINPGANEICDGVDNNCDGATDTGFVVGAPSWFDDVDGDGFGDASDLGTIACNAPPDTVADNGDCDDSSAAIHPGVAEVCDGADNDCNGQVDAADPGLTNGTTYYDDGDGDSYGDENDTGVLACTQPAGTAPNALDCDDSDASVRPGQIETCNGVDDDCSGVVDDGAAASQTVYADLDDDGYGNSASPFTGCPPPAGYVSNSADCDDAHDTVFPGAFEICDGLDNDCNSLVDDNAPELDYYPDNDGDGHGAGVPIQSCSPPIGYALSNDDCNDNDDTISPSAAELCDPVDRDCDGNATAGAADATTRWIDLDGDGFGNPAQGITACSHPPTYVTNSGDCNDAQPLAWTDKEEVCDGVDNDCSGNADGADATGASAWYPDLDNDNFGAGVAVVQCNQPAGHRANSTDCDDSDNSVNPGAPEQCDDVDHNCNGITDDGVANQLWYLDADQDGYGETATTAFDCLRPVGYAGLPGDCNDADSAVNPGVVEFCDGVDDNCEGSEDDAVDKLPFFPDGDGDGWGLVGTIELACEPPPNAAERVGDCDDATASVNPDATEICDGFDNDCDGLVDVFAVDSVLYYQDGDGDGFGAPDVVDAYCPGDQPVGWVANNTDCDDGEPLAFGGAVEVCDGIDNDCDGLTDSEDDPVTGDAQWIPDLDGDGYGDANATPVFACDPPADHVQNTDDCDDTEPAAWTGAPEVCDGVDNDCSGAADAEDPNVDPDDVSTWFPDGDGDGFGDAQHEGILACSAPEGAVQDATDCDDRDAEVNTDAEEVCGDNVDNDCDGTVDEDCATGGKATGCNCDTPGSGAGWLVLGLLPVLARRRAA